MKRWAKKNIFKWSIIIAALTFLLGPLVQGVFTDLLKDKLGLERGIEIYVCTPLRSATLLVSSSNGNERKMHSANYYPFSQRALVIVVNNTDNPVPDSSVFVAPLNTASNYLWGANFQSDNNNSRVDYSVNELPYNAFHIELGNFASNQILALEFVTMLPTSFVVEFSGQTESKKQVVNAGYCDTGNAPDGMILPVDFFTKSDFPETKNENLIGAVDDIHGPIGPLSFEIILDFDCGAGLERKVIPIGGSVEYCGMRINVPPES